jgi:hypothetical protein
VKKTPKAVVTGTTTATPAAPVGPGPLNLTLSDPTQATSIEVVCATSGFRQRGAISGGRASVANVPIDSCTMIFHGGPPAKFAPVHGGMSLTCNIVDTTAVCN